MKKLLLVLLTIISINCYSQDSTKVDTAKLTATKIYNDVKTGISGLAAGLKVGAEHVYSVLVKQQIINSVIYLIIGIMFLILLFITFKVSKKAAWGDNVYYKADWDSREQFEAAQFNRHSVATLIFGLATFIAGLIFFLDLPEMVTGFLNPEYLAIQNILKFIK